MLVFTCVSCGREQVARESDLRRHPRYPRDVSEVRCRWRDCRGPNAVQVVDGRLKQWAARGDRLRPGQLEVAPRGSEFGVGPTGTEMQASEVNRTRSGLPRGELARRKRAARG